MGHGGHWPLTQPVMTPVGQQRPAQTTFPTQQNLSVPEVSSSRQLRPAQHCWAVQLWPAFAQVLPPGAGITAPARPDPSNAPADAPTSAPKKPRREDGFAARSFVSSSNLSPLTVLPRRALHQCPFPALHQCPFPAKARLEREKR
jgi:hypothetical protein